MIKSKLKFVVFFFVIISGFMCLPIYGYTFSKDYDFLENQSKLNSGDIIYEKSESQESFSIAYHLNGGENHLDNPETFIADDLPVALQESKKTGYNFQGWYNNELTDGEAITHINEANNIELWAKWSDAIVYHINYRNVEEVTHDNPTTFTVNDLPIQLKNASKQGSTFKGWIRDIASDYLAYYKFNGNTNDETSRYNATNSGATLTTGITGSPNTAYYFDGNVNIIDTETIFNFTEAFSFSFWAKIESYGPASEGGLFIVQGGALGHNNTATDFSISSNTANGGVINLGIRDGGITAQTNVELNTWLHVVATWKKGVERKLYINGELKSTTQSPGGISYINNLSCRFGAWGWSGWSQNHQMKGSLDNMRIYDYDLSAEQINAIHNLEQGSWVTEGAIELITEVGDIELTATFETITNIESPTNENQIILYPNPASDELSIEIKGVNKAITFKILNIQGRSMLNGEFVGKNSIKISHLEPGLYFIKLSYEEKTEVVKFLKE